MNAIMTPSLKARDITSHMTKVKMLCHPVFPLLELLVKAHDEEGGEGLGWEEEGGVGFWVAGCAKILTCHVGQ